MLVQIVPVSLDLRTMLSCRVVENFFNVNSSEIAAECLKMFEVSNGAKGVATRKRRFVKKYVLNSSIVCEICAICS